MIVARHVSGVLALTMAAAMASTSGVWAQDAGTLVVDTAFQLKTADPAREFEPTANLVLHPVYETLVTFTGSDLTKVVPSLASLPVIAPDAKTFTFTLNPAAKFSDGSPVTVDDVIFSFNRVKNVKGSPSFLLDGVTVAKGAKDGEIVLTTEQPDPGLPFKLANPAVGIVNAKVVSRLNQGSADEGADKTDRADSFLATTSAGSGPYVLDKFDMAAEVVLKRNDAYWGDQAAIRPDRRAQCRHRAQQMNVMRGDSQIALDLRPDQLDADQGHRLHALGSGRRRRVHVHQFQSRISRRSRPIRTSSRRCVSASTMTARSRLPARARRVRARSSRPCSQARCRRRRARSAMSRPPRPRSPRAASRTR